MSLSCALLATSLHQWARRYIRLTQPARRTPEKRARMRAFYADGVEKMHVPWAVEGLPTLLHISMFLFFGGVAIFLFNLDSEVFTCVVCWIGLFLIVYGLITLLPLIRHENPYYTPLSKPAWYLFSSIAYVTFKVLTYIAHGFGAYRIWDLCYDLKYRYRYWISGGMEKTAEKTAEKETSEIDLRILDWTFTDSLLGDDDSLEKFFQSIPGLFDSPRLVVKYDFSPVTSPMFWDALDGFMRRSWSVTESIKIRWDNFCKDIIRVSRPWRIPDTRISRTTQSTVVRSLLRTQERDDNWVEVASALYGLLKDIIERHVKLGGGSTILAILIDTCRHKLQESQEWELIEYSSISSRTSIKSTSTYFTLFPRCSMTSVRCGTNWSQKQRTEGLTPILSVFSVRSANSTFLYIKAPMLPQLRSPLSPIVPTVFWVSHRHIQCATSPAIAQTPCSIPLPLAVAPLYGKLSNRALQDPLLHPIRRLPAKFVTVLEPLQPRIPPFQLTPVHTPQMRRHQVLRCQTFPRPLRCLIPCKDPRGGIWSQQVPPPPPVPCFLLLLLLPSLSSHFLHRPTPHPRPLQNHLPSSATQHPPSQQVITHSRACMLVDS